MFTSLNNAISSLFGNNIDIKYISRIAGGDINTAVEIMLTSGERVFMKLNKRSNLSFFEAETKGLEAIAATGAIGVPKILGYGTDRENAFLLLKYIEGKKHVSSYWEIFGRQLAAMHKADTSGYVTAGIYGFDNDNYIGYSKQINTPHRSWICFFRECRLEPQFKTAEKYFDNTERKKILKLLDKLETLLIEPEHPSLLHGDLWSGNFVTGANGKAWLIDPAVYVGHAEADVAMTELFGGFSPEFYKGYQEIEPLQSGYADRRDLYNLYHLVNHLNMFGGLYLSSVKRIVKRYV